MVSAIRDSFLLGALWGSGAGLLEGFLANHRFRVGLQNPLYPTELVLNYALYAGLGAGVFRVVLEALRDKGVLGKGRDGAVAGVETSTQSLGHERDAGMRLVEALVGAGLFVAAVASYIQKNPSNPLPLMSPITLGIAVASLVLMGALAWIVYRLGSAQMRVLRAGLVLWIVVGLAWDPLFGSYNGLFDRDGGKAPAGTHRNVLLILTDSERADFLTCYGAKWGASPTSDRVAAGGVLFENHVAQSTWTLPSIANIFTGLYPSSHGAVAQGYRVSSTAPFLVEVFRNAGYRTAAFAETPYFVPRSGFGRGFDHFWASPCVLSWAFDYTFLYRLRGRIRVPAIELTKKGTNPNPATPEEVEFDSRVVTDAALSWLRDLDDAPFFAYVHYWGAHAPYGPREFLLDRDPPSKRIMDNPVPAGGAFPVGKPGIRISDEATEDLKVLYAANIRYTEQQIARILDWLEETGKLSETLVVLTSDHGEEFYEHNAWEHGSSAFQEQAHVPLIIHAPGLIPPGKRITKLTRHIDVMPTLLDLVGLECPKEAQGQSLRGLLEDRATETKPAYVEVCPISPDEADIFALFGDPYKIVHVSLGERSDVLLYDLESDPGETHNIAAVHPELRDSLLIEMEKWDQVAHLYKPDSGTGALDPGSIKLFKALGYINQ